MVGVENGALDHFLEHVSVWIKMRRMKIVPYVEVGWMSIKEGGTRWRSLSVIFDEILSMAENVWRFGNGVCNGKNDDVEWKWFIFSFGTINCSIEFVIVDRN